jgi:uncharacterized protein (DUF433 family)
VLRKEDAMSDWQARITVAPKIVVGKPVIRGTRIPVELIVHMLGQGISEEEILEDYPWLQVEDIRAALNYAASVLAREDIFPTTSINA